MPAPSSTTVRIGQILAQRYRVQRLLGEGAVGAVFSAEDIESGGLVAIKVLKHAQGADPVAMERFRREIEATSRFECEYVVRTLGGGHLEDGVPFMVMEYLDALDLAKTIARDGPLPVEKSIAFGLQICLALAHAHRSGIVHRDIKPANLLVVNQPYRKECIKVLDFGLSKFASHEPIQVKLTASAVRLGSPMYMSPEQRTSAREVDERSDIWSLGITLFEMMTGVWPFDSTPKSLRQGVEAPTSVPSLSRHRPGIPRELDRVIARCLQRMPAARFQNVAELASALAWFVKPEIARMSGEVARALGPPRFVTSHLLPDSVEPGGFRTAKVGPGTTLGPAISEGPATVRVTSPTRRNALWTIAALITVCVSTFGSWFALRSSDSSNRPIASSPMATVPVPAGWATRARIWDRASWSRFSSLETPVLSANSAAPPPKGSPQGASGEPRPEARTRTEPRNLEPRNLEPRNLEPRNLEPRDSELPAPIAPTTGATSPPEPRPDMGY